MSVEFLSLAEGALAYQRQVGTANRPGIVFLGGFASDMTGTKAAFLASRCAEHSLSFVRFDYSGCGQSSGLFINGTIGRWLTDTCVVLDRLTEGPQIVVGSSMGAWLGLLATLARPERAKAFIGVAAAPDFTENLVWDRLTLSQREDLLKNGQILERDENGNNRPPITLKLIEEGRSHLLLQQPLPIDCPVRLLQGKQDEEVPWQYAERIIKRITHSNKGVRYIEGADHRLSAPDNLEELWAMVAEFALN